MFSKHHIGIDKFADSILMHNGISQTLILLALDQQP